MIKRYILLALIGAVLGVPGGAFLCQHRLMQKVLNAKVPDYMKILQKDLLHIRYKGVNI
jgi:hypothetical protein